MAPSNNLESAMVITLAPAAYTILLQGKGTAAGIAKVEVIDLGSAGDAHLANMSTRLQTGTGENVLIGGFVINGPNNQQVVLRGLGPSLPVQGTMQDPTLSLRDSNGNELVFNNDWKDTQQAAILAIGTSRHPAVFDILKEKWERSAGDPLRKTLLLAMALTRSEAAITFLISLLESSNAPTAKDVVTSLAIFRDNEKIRHSIEDVVSRRGDKNLVEALRREFHKSVGEP